MLSRIADSQALGQKKPMVASAYRRVRDEMVAPHA
jgi:hypothetical protein